MSLDDKTAALVAKALKEQLRSCVNGDPRNCYACELSDKAIAALEARDQPLPLNESELVKKARAMQVWEWDANPCTRETLATRVEQLALEVADLKQTNLRLQDDCVQFRDNLKKQLAAANTRIAALEMVLTVVKDDELIRRLLLECHAVDIKEVLHEKS
jgi:hypothetical protein